MIIVKLMGGLGNQMFQYAMGRSLAERNNTELIVDTSFLEDKNSGVTVFRDYELDLFPNIKEKKLQSSVEAVPFYESHFHCDERLLNVKTSQNIYMTGYWQTYKYFNDINDTIIEEFKFPIIQDERTRLLQEEIVSRNSVMINVRRSDYLTDSLFENLDMDYYNQSVEKITDMVDDPMFYVFSDDIEWCRENFTEDKFFIVDKSYAGPKYIDYLHLMSSCKHHIIPNSTFAWWAAWLHQGEDQIVTYPSKWFTDKSKDTKDICPPEWIKL
tara:strand:- start:663 stop:1472 length:810 start_codon:yes stop_codon:yes gene_type:complete